MHTHTHSVYLCVCSLSEIYAMLRICIYINTYTCAVCSMIKSGCNFLCRHSHTHTYVDMYVCILKRIHIWIWDKLWWITIHNRKKRELRWHRRYNTYPSQINKFSIKALNFYRSISMTAMCYIGLIWKICSKIIPLAWILFHDVSSQRQLLWFMLLIFGLSNIESEVQARPASLNCNFREHVCLVSSRYTLNWIY